MSEYVETESSGRPGPGTYLGLFLISLTTLMYQVLLTRIFSVTMWYHFAFVSISIAMFGMTVGALAVFLFQNFFTVERAKVQLAVFSLLSSVGVATSFLTHLVIQFEPLDVSIVGLYSKLATYLAIAVPFAFAGVAVCIALTRFPRHVGGLYGVDLAGAALGTVLIVLTLEWLKDAPSAVFVAAAVAGLASLAFALDAPKNKTLILWCLAATIAWGGSAGYFAKTARQGEPKLALTWVKGRIEERPLYERWNIHSRIRIDDVGEGIDTPFGWGFSPKYDGKDEVEQYFLKIDDHALTVLTKFDGDLSAVDYLKYDISNLAHYVRPEGSIAIIGSGGGRDVLSALLFGKTAILAIEINKEILYAANEKFGDFTGHLDRYPEVEFIHDEARSFLTRTDKRFDIIQASLIDTWAATASGAFVLSENALYTVEAWQEFLAHLTPGGLITFSRFYVSDSPGEVYRLMDLAVTSLREFGVAEPSKHIVMVRHLWEQNASTLQGVGTILVGRDPWTEADLKRLTEVCEELEFELVYTPNQSLDPVYTLLADARTRDEFLRSYELDVSAPTDDKPFFFHTLRPKDFFKTAISKRGYLLSFNHMAVTILVSLLFVVAMMTALAALVPMSIMRGKISFRGSGAFFLYFGSIGLGFMIVEISMTQRLNVFLGHPVYSLTVVLFSLLLSSGLGSMSTDRLTAEKMGLSAGIRLGLLVVAMIAFGIFAPDLLVGYRGADTPTRIAIAVAMLFPMGFFMGMAFPIGIKLASATRPELTPWLWGINGATSILATVLAVVISLVGGISAAFWIGLGCYGIAICSLLPRLMKKTSGE